MKIKFIKDHESGIVAGKVITTSKPHANSLIEMGLAEAEQSEEQTPVDDTAVASEPKTTPKRTRKAKNTDK